MERARDLFYALWIPDLFMKRVESGKCGRFHSHHFNGKLALLARHYKETTTTAVTQLLRENDKNNNPLIKRFFLRRLSFYQSLHT